MEKLIGVSLVILSIFFYAPITPLVKKISQSFPPFTIMTISMLVLFLCSLVLSIAFENFLNLKFLSDKNAMKNLILIGIINTVAFYLAVKSLKYLPVWQQTMFSVLTPVLASIFAYFILAEKISLKMFLGLAVMAFGLLIALVG